MSDATCVGVMILISHISIAVWLGWKLDILTGVDEKLLSILAQCIN